MKPVQKEKKVTVKFFLNQLVEAVTGEKGKKYYPLYIQVTYNRKNMQFKSKYGLYYRDLKQTEPALIQFEENTLRKIIQYEARQKSDDYDLKGLKRKYEIYSMSVLEAVEQYLKPKLRSAVLDTGHELSNVLNFSNPEVTVEHLYKAAQLLFQDFETDLPVRLQDELTVYEQYLRMYNARMISQYNFPTLIDWINSPYRKELEMKVKEAYKNKTGMAKKVLDLVEDAVIERLKRISD